jgi:hypothetical protein
MTYICGVEDKIGVTLLFFFPLQKITPWMNQCSMNLDTLGSTTMTAGTKARERVSLRRRASTFQLLTVKRKIAYYSQFE